MPFSYMGCGTTFYGKRDFWSDGSYLTTEWFTLFLIPIIPLHSWRTKPHSVTSEYEYSGGVCNMAAIKEFEVYSKQRPSAKQVAFTYLYSIGTPLYLVFAVSGPMLLHEKRPDIFSDTLAMVSTGSLLLGWGLLPLILRCWARRKSRVLPCSSTKPTSSEIGYSPNKTNYSYGIEKSPLSHLAKVEEVIREKGSSNRGVNGKSIQSQCDEPPEKKQASK